MECVGLAISEDGVHFKEYGVVLRKLPSAEIIGTDCILEQYEYGFIMSFSEWIDGV